MYGDAEWNWVELTARHSLGWVVARDAERLVGFVNVIWDGLVHAWIQGSAPSKGACALLELKSRRFNTVETSRSLKPPDDDW